MSDFTDVEEVMKKMARRLDINENDKEARAIFDRASELLTTIWMEEKR